MRELLNRVCDLGLLEILLVRTNHKSGSGFGGATVQVVRSGDPVSFNTTVDVLLNIKNYLGQAVSATASLLRLSDTLQNNVYQRTISQYISRNITSACGTVAHGVQHRQALSQFAKHRILIASLA